MRDFGKVQCAIWHHPDFRALDERARLVVLYLLTGPHSNGLGCYRLPELYIAADFGWTPEVTQKALGDVEALGWLCRFPGSDYLLIPSYLRWNAVSNGNVAQARMQDFQEIPSREPVRPHLARAMLAFGNHFTEKHVTELQMVSETVSEPSAETVSKGSPETVPEETPELREERRGEGEREREQRTACPESRDGESPEPLSLVPAEPPPRVVRTLPTTPNDGDFEVDVEQVAKWAQAYPALDVVNHLDRMAAWLEANPTRLKTNRGMPRFCTSWLEREQNKGGDRGASGQRSTGPSGIPFHTQQNVSALTRALEEGPTHGDV